MKTTKSWSVAFPLREQRQTRYKYENDNTLKRYIPDIDEDFLSDLDKLRYLELRKWIVEENKEYTKSQRKELFRMYVESLLGQKDYINNILDDQMG